MKNHLHIRRTVMMLVAVLACLSTAHAVEVDRTDEIKHAVRVLKGIDKDQTQDWAIAVLKTEAEADRIPFAMISLKSIHTLFVFINETFVKVCL